MKLFLLHLFSLVFPQASAQFVVDLLGNAERGGNNCTVKPKRTDTVYIGWPHVLSCKMLLESLVMPSYDQPPYEQYDGDDIPDYEEDSSYNATCCIWDLDNNRLVFNKTVNKDRFHNLFYGIKDISTNTSRNYSIEGWISGLKKDCVSFRYQLMVIDFPNQTCNEAYNLSNPMLRKIPVEHHVSFSCIDRSNKHVTILPNYTVNWYRNCDVLPKDHLLSGHGNSELHLKRPSYEHPGLYSCAVKHNGMKQFINHFRLCIRPPYRHVQHSIKCSKDIYHATIGNDVKLTCNATLDHSMSKEVHNTVIWTKVSSGRSAFSCTNEFKDPTKSKTNEKATCTYYSSKQETDFCFHTPPSEEQLAIPAHVFVMSLEIKKVEKGDFGTYTVKLISAANALKSVNATIVLAEDSIPFLVRNTTALGASAIVFVLVMVMLGYLCWKKQIYFKVYYKRRFGENSTNNREYGAFFSYHFSYDLDKFAQDQVRDVIAVVRDELESQGYKIYDETKDNCEIRPRVENVLSFMKQSHRVVIILTTEYVKDHWKVFTLQKGFEEMIKSESKLIFILVPGVKEYIKQHAAEEKTYRMIQTAMGVNYAIEWSNKKFNRKLFSLQLELAMPKLSKHKVKRTSTTSSVTSQQVLYRNGFMRTLSNETRTTEVSSPVATNEEFVVISEEPAL